MGALEQILRYKEIKESQRNADIQAIPAAIQAFGAGRQQATDNLLKSLTLQATLAKSGFRMDEKGGLVRDESLNSLDSLKKLDLVSKIENRSVAQGLLQKALGGQGGDVTPGTRVTVAGVSVPLNPKLTDAEQSTVAGYEKFEPLVQEIQSLVDGGVFKKEGIGRGYEQFLAEGGGDPIRRLLTKDGSSLEKLASAAAEMKKFAFAEGGKQLSPTEKEVVQAGLSFTGKSDEAIKRDFAAAIDIIRKKKALALGGANTAKSDSKTVETQASLPSGITEEDIAFTMKKHGLSREEVLRRLND